MHWRCAYLKHVTTSHLIMESVTSLDRSSRLSNVVSHNEHVVLGPGFVSTSPASSISKRVMYSFVPMYFCPRLLGIGRGSSTVYCAATRQRHHGVYCTVSSVLHSAHTATAASSAYVKTFPPIILQFSATRCFKMWYPILAVQVFITKDSSKDGASVASHVRHPPGRCVS